MTKCPKCGAEMPDNEEFCMRCGNTLSTTSGSGTSASAPKEEPKKKSKAWLWILIIIIVLVIIGGGIIGIGFYAYKKISKGTNEVTEVTTDEKAKVEITWEAEKRLPTAFYTNKTQKLIEFKIKSDKPTKVKLEIEIPQITEKETKEIDVDTTEQTIEFKPPFKTEAYGPLSKAQEKYISIKATDKNSKEAVLETSEKITVLSRNDMVWMEEDGTDNSKYIAKWVTKNNKEVKELVRVAAEYNNQFCGRHAMIGYLGTPDDVLCQMASLFAAVSDHFKVTYIAALESYQTTNAQSIKLPEEVLTEKSGLCIETAILMAAAMENLSMEPVIIIIPGHAWVAVKTYAGAPTYYHLETTMLDSPVLDALNQGETNWAENSNQAKVIDIKKAREEGIQPYGEAESGQQAM